MTYATETIALNLSVGWLCHTIIIIRKELVKNMKCDCFISTILYLVDIWERKELVNSILLLTYGFHYNVNWKTVNDTIVFSYMKEEL